MQWVSPVSRWAAEPSRLKFPPLTVGYLMAMGAIFFDISLLGLSGPHAATPTREPAVFLG
jgi:hypothetical protein